MSKGLALGVVFLGAIVAIAPYNPFGEPNLHPNPFIVLAGSVVAILGALLMLFAVRPLEPKVRIAGWVLIVVFLLLAGMAFLMP